MTHEEYIEDLRKHQARVMELVQSLVALLLVQTSKHDVSKSLQPEIDVFREYTPRLKTTEYRSPEYKQCMDAMRSAIDHHYQQNRHHPQHFPNGIMGMNLLDIIEMLCDWKAAGERHGDYGHSLSKSIELNTERFTLDPQFKQILLNTVPLLENQVENPTT